MHDTEKLKKLITTPARTLLTLHKNPDGDSIGSNIALYNALKEHGHTVDLFVIDPVPSFYSFVDGIDQASVPDEDELDLSQYDNYFALDMSELDRSHFTLKNGGDCEIINIDHHTMNDEWGTINFVEHNGPSTCTLLYRFFKDMKLDIDERTAKALLLGMLTDTNFMSRPDVPPSVFTDVAELQELGARYSDIAENLNKISLNTLDMLQEGLSHLEHLSEKNVLLTHLSFPDKDGFNRQEFDNMVSIMQRVSGIKGIAVLIEEKPNWIRLRLRSMDDSYDVSKVAEVFGGGGHTGSAGAYLEIPMEEALDRVKEEL